MRINQEINELEQVIIGGDMLEAEVKSCLVERRPWIYKVFPLSGLLELE